MVKHSASSVQTEPTPLPIQILQLSDPHLLADKAHSFIGINPWLSLQHIINDAQHFGPYDCVLSTGDLAQEPCVSAYQDYLQEVDKLGSQHLYIRGNHDAGSSFPNNPNIRDVDVQVLNIKNWCLIGLNSQTDAGSFGYLKASVLAELQHQLACHAQQHILIAVHHHSLNVGCAWLDQQNLRNAQQFLDCLHHYPQVKAVVNGHVHQATEQYQDNIVFMSCPSTCVQFTPNSDQFSLDPRPPGYRILKLHHDGSLSSSVKYLAQSVGQIDAQLTHY